MNANFVTHCYCRPNSFFTSLWQKLFCFSTQRFYLFRAIQPKFDVYFTMFRELSQIETHKLDFKEKAEAKIGSKDNMNHVPGGGRREVSFVFCTILFMTSVM